VIRRFSKKTETEEHTNQERWLLTYSDMITLLLALFIVLYAVSKVDQKKLSEVATDIRKGFGVKSPQSVVLLDGGSGILEEETMEPKSLLYRLWERIGYALKSLPDKTKFKLGLNETEELKLVFFGGGFEETKVLENNPDFDYALQKLAELSQEMDLEFMIRLQIPNETGKENFRNAWDFRAHQASKIAEILVKKYGIPEEKIIVQGQASFQKSKLANTPEKKAQQERMEIIIRKKEPLPE